VGTARQSSEHRERLLGADFLRAAACLAVLFHHLAQRMSWDHDMGALGFMRGFALAGAFGVPVFFVLSGFLLSRPFWIAFDSGAPAPSLRDYAVRRAARILPGYWIVLVATLIAAVAFFGTRLDGEVALRFAAGAFGLAGWHWLTLYPVDVNGPLWSICYELSSYVFLPLAFALLFACRGRVAGWVQSRLLWVGVIGLALVGHWAFMQANPSPGFERGWEFGLLGGAKIFMPRYNPVGFFAMFATGALAAGMQVAIASRRSWVFDLLALYAIAFAALVLWVHIWVGAVDVFGWLDLPYRSPWFVLVVGAFLVVAPSSRLVGRLLDNVVSRYVARLSFGIYIWHYLVLELVRLFVVPEMDHGRMTDIPTFALACGLVVAASFAIAEASYRFVELPAMKWARRLEHHAPQASDLASPRTAGTGP